MLHLPKEEVSYWRESYAGSIYPELNQDLNVDVVIVGGGITGLTSAYLLKQSGLRVALLEKDTIGAGTTGHTTGKVSSLHGLTYNDLQEQLGEKTARIYGQANQTAIKKISGLIRTENIDCNWQTEDNYVYTADAKNIKKFKQEAETAARLGLPASFETQLNLPFKIIAAVKFSGQAQFNAQKYVLGLAAAVGGNGSYVFENSRAIGFRDGNPGKVRTKKAAVFAKNIIVTTNVPSLPLIARGSYCALEYPHTSYIVAGLVKEKVKGMYISPDKHHYSLLPVTRGKEQLLLVGGKNHIPGVRLSSKARYQKLADYGHDKFGMSKVLYRWSARDYMAYDSLPLIGRVYPWSKCMYTATAFKKWGLAHSMVAGTILHDLIIGKENPWAAIYTTQRFKPIASIPRVIVKNIISQR